MTPGMLLEHELLTQKVALGNVQYLVHMFFNPRGSSKEGMIPYYRLLNKTFYSTSTLAPQAWPIYLVGACHSYVSFTARSFYPHLHGNSTSLGTNVTVLGQNYKYSGWHRFHYFQINEWSSFTCQRSLVAYVTGYCHIGSQRGRVPTLVRTGRPGSEGGVGGAEPN